MKRHPEHDKIKTGSYSLNFWLEKVATYRRHSEILKAVFMKAKTKTERTDAAFSGYSALLDRVNFYENAVIERGGLLLLKP